MSKHASQEEYENAKAKHKERAREKEKMIQQDLKAIRQKYMPKHLKRKIITSCAVFTSVYLTEELTLRKKIPGIIKFAGAVAATVMAPKLYSLIHDRYLKTGENNVLGEVATIAAPEAQEPVAGQLPEDEEENSTYMLPETE